jgi:ribosomal protein S20
LIKKKQRLKLKTSIEKGLFQLKEGKKTLASEAYQRLKKKITKNVKENL